MPTLKAIFDEVVDRVLLLLHEPVQAVGAVRGPKKLPILLVGGFGNSEYLKARIIDTFAQCEVLQPPDAYVTGIVHHRGDADSVRWSAVVRGALKRSLIKKRKIRAAYGVKCERKWCDKHERGSIYFRDVRPEFEQVKGTSTFFTSGLNLNFTRVEDSYKGGWTCKNHMDCFIKKVRTVKFDCIVSRQ